MECSLAEYQALGQRNALPPPLPVAAKDEVLTWTLSFQGAPDTSSGLPAPGDAALFANGDVGIAPLDGSAYVTLPAGKYAAVLDVSAKTVTVSKDAPAIPATVTSLVTKRATV